ncbi:MAG: phosphoribosyl-ATP diphosphatase, partial [Holophaga sp.]|nr:phosphoribosyl-ATP diphosphatase [Holophaga sp.]
MLIPSIDLMDGKAVQLVGGRTKVLEVEDVLGLAQRWRVYGDLAVIDLDAAMGRGDNLD